MNNLTKAVVVSTFIFHPIVVFSATPTADDGLASYLKNYHPETYSAAQRNGVDINSFEFSDSNVNNSADASVNDQKGLSLALPIIRPPISPGFLCERAGGIFLENNFVATCVSEDGTFGNGSEQLGMTFNPAGTGTVYSPDYLQPGSPHEYFSVTFNQQLFTNNNRNGSAIVGSDNIPTKIHTLDRYTALQSGGAMVKSSITDKRGQLEIVQKYTLDPNSKEIIVRVEMQNTGNTVLHGVTYARGLDPDQNRPNTFHTINRKGHSYNAPFPGKTVHVEPNNIAWASGKNNLSVALYSVDPVSHDTCISSTWTTNPEDILNQNCGLPTQPVYDVPAGSYGFDYSDSTINIAFKVGQLASKEKRVFSFKYLFDKEKARIKPEPIPIPIPIPIVPVK